MTSIRLIELATICLVASMLLAWYIYPMLVKMAYSKRILDHPNMRKLQKRPVPVIGGVGVSLSALTVLLMSSLVIGDEGMLMPVGCLLIMFFVGMIDDMMGISFRAKFLYQAVAVFMLWYSGMRIDTLCGVFGVQEMGVVPSLLLSMLAGVGLINAMNLIDGVDGLSSGTGMLTGVLVCITMLLHGDAQMAVMSACYVGALVPFFVYNVFSRKYKMFIGDSGSLVLGLLAYIYTCRIIHLPHIGAIDNYSVSMMLALYAVPVLDTVRVMVMRMMRGESPFLPDKTHLHHLFIGMRYTHVLTTMIILVMQILIIAMWAITAIAIPSVTCQTIASVALSAAMVWGVYWYISRQREEQSPSYVRMVARARRRGRSVRGGYYRIQCQIDRKRYPPPEPPGADNANK